MKKVTFDGFLIGLFPFLQFIEGSFEEYLKRLENPQVCSNLVIYFFSFFITVWGEYYSVGRSFLRHSSCLRCTVNWKTAGAVYVPWALPHSGQSHAFLICHSECSTKTWSGTAEDFQRVVLVCAWGLVDRAVFDCFLRQLTRQGPFPLTWSAREVGRDCWGLKDSPSPPTPTATMFSVTWKLKEVFCLLFSLLLRNLMLSV